MVITKIEQAKKRESRVNIFLDEEFWIGLDKNDLLLLGLFKGKEISPEEKKEVEKAAGFNKVLEKAINYTIVRPRSEKEMREYLLYRRNLLQEDALRMIQVLKEKGFLDDEKFTEWYIQNRMDFGAHGENKIYSELLSKGISSSRAREVLKRFINEESKPEILEKINAFVKKSLPGIKADSDFERRQKLTQKLLSRGFKYSDISKVLKDIF